MFTFLLMMAVASTGMLVGYRLVTGRDLVTLSEFGVAGQAEVQVISPVLKGTTSPTPSPTPTALPSATPSPTPAPETQRFMVIGNTDGQGVYLRRTPRMDDKLQAWPDNTRMELLGEVVQGDGRTWRKVRAPNGAEGYIPAEFLVAAP